MCQCEFEEYNGQSTWFTGNIKETKKGISLNLTANNKIIKTIGIPSENFPLQNSNVKFFCYTNTHLIKKDEYPDIVKAFDDTPYLLGGVIQTQRK